MAQFTDYWSENSRSAKTVILLGLLILIVFTVVAIYWTLSTPKGVLFKDLEPQNAAGIVAGLDRLKVDYQLSEGGATILIDQDLVHDTRLKLMSSGVQLSGGIGFEVFDKTEFGMTEFAQRINFQRALQGELSRTITALKEVKHARVHLVLPERGLFRKEKQSPTASVIVFLNGNQSLDAEQIVGIQRLVASSVPELDEGMVAIINEKGITLSRAVIKDKDFEVADLRLQRKKEIENYLAKKVTHILAQSINRNDAVVSVDVVLNFDKIRTTNESVLPNQDGSKNIVRKRDSNSEGEGNKTRKSKLVDSEVEYKYGRLVEQVVRTPGSIERMSIAVMIAKEIDQKQLQQIRELVTAAVGLRAARGDMVTVQSIKSDLTILDDRIVSQEPVEILPQRTNAVLENVTINSSSDKTVTETSVEPYTLYSQIMDIFENRELAITIIVGLLLGVILLLILLLLTQKRVQPATLPHQLSDHERERVLKLLQEWLASENEVKEGGAVS
ncbi:MAG: flagellar basal-body MS-ring/collar protein FliF [Candidatus Sedimenticola sp. (ex Thyasira tokunagai)]